MSGDRKGGIDAAKTPAERIDAIRRLMANGRWVTGVTGLDLAKHWRVTPETVRRYAAEASRALRADESDLDDLRARNRATLETIVSEAMASKDLRSAIAAIATMADLLGLKAPTKIEASVGVSLDELDEIRRAAEANTNEGKPECSTPKRSRKPSKKRAQKS